MASGVIKAEVTLAVLGFIDSFGSCKILRDVVWAFCTSKVETMGTTISVQGHPTAFSACVESMWEFLIAFPRTKH